MKFTTEWLKDHLKTNKTEAQIIDKLNKLIELTVHRLRNTRSSLDNVMGKIPVFQYYLEPSTIQILF